MAQSADTGRVYVATYSEPNRVAGYYALATGAVAQADATERALKGAGRYPISAMILTRLGVDKTAQNQGLGRALVRDAMRRVQQAADIVAARVLLIHAESEDARAFYLRLAEFEASPSDRLHLLLTLKELRAILAG
jgi:GNAT superfamily N-acetyltransferase